MRSDKPVRVAFKLPGRRRHEDQQIGLHQRDVHRYSVTWCASCNAWRPDRLNADQRRDRWEIVEDRHGAGSTLTTSQVPIDNGTRLSPSRPSLTL